MIKDNKGVDKEMNTEAIIFDLDGTLIDSTGVWEQVDRLFLRENGIDPPKDISEKVKTMTIEQSSQYFIERFKLPLTQEHIINRIEEIVSEQYHYHIGFKEGAERFLDRLDEKNIPYCIATAGYKSLAEAVVRRLGLEKRIKFLLTCSELKVSKNSPEIFFESLRRLGTEKDNTLVIEDSLHSIKTAKGEGFRTVGVADRCSENDWGEIVRIADITVKRLDNLKIL